MNIWQIVGGYQGKMKRCKFDKRYLCDYSFMGDDRPCEKCEIFHTCGQLTLLQYVKKKK